MTPASRLIVRSITLFTSVGCGLDTFGGSLGAQDTTAATTDQPTMAGPPATGKTDTSGALEPTSTTGGVAAGDTDSTGETGEGTSTAASTSTGGASTTIEDTSSGDSTTESDDMSTTGGASTTGVSDACNDACGGRAPICDPGTMTCVGCLQAGDCPVVTPVCAAKSCVACTQHAQCPVTACDIETGQCLPESCVMHVGQPTFPGFCSDMNDGKTPETPLCSLEEAVSRLVANKPCTIKVNSDLGTGSAGVVIPSGAYTVAFVGVGDPDPIIKQQWSLPLLKVNAANRVYLNGLSLEVSASGPGITCNHGGLWLDRVRLERGNSNPDVYGLNSFNCQVHIRRSILTDFSAGGVEIKGDDMGDAELWVENSYFTFLGSAGFGAIRLAGEVDASLLYTTIAINQGQGPQLDCVDAFDGALAVRNTVLIDPDLRIGAACLPFLDGDDVYESGEATPGELAATFSGFDNGVFKAKVGGQLMNAAFWYSGDPALDYDGTPRPFTNGDPDYVGADRP